MRVLEEAVRPDGAVGAVEPRPSPRPAGDREGAYDLNALEHEDIDFGPLEAELEEPLAPGAMLPIEDFAQHLLREAFAETVGRWEEFYSPSLLSPDADYVFKWMTSRIADEPSDGPPWEDYDPRLSSLLSTGLGGYAWRAAEEAAGRGIGVEIIDGVREAIGSVTRSDPPASAQITPEQAVLYQASAGALVKQVPLWYTTPGYHGWGGVLFRAGWRYVSDRVVTADPPPHVADINYAFSFGVALRHVEQQLVDAEAPEPGAWTGSDWEMCEIELRPDGRSFVAVAQRGDEQYVVAESRRLPANRHPLPLSIDRRPDQIMSRHEALVEELERQGWAPITGSSADWWAHRFRRQVTQQPS